MNTQLRPRLALLLASFSTVASGNATKINIRGATVVPRLPTLPWPWSWSGHAHTLTWGTSQDGLDPTPVLDVLITKDVVYVQGELFTMVKNIAPCCEMGLLCVWLVLGRTAFCGPRRCGSPRSFPIEGVYVGQTAPAPS